MIAGLSGSPLPASFPFAADFNLVGEAHDLPPKLIAAIAQRETLKEYGLASATKIQNGALPTGYFADGTPAGHGIMQLTDSWPANWSDPLTNISYAASTFIKPAWDYWHGLEGYIGESLVKLVAATYNEGLGAAEKYHGEGDVDLGTTDKYGEGVLENFIALCDNEVAVTPEPKEPAHETVTITAHPSVIAKVKAAVGEVASKVEPHPTEKAAIPAPAKVAVPATTGIHPKVAVATLGGAIATLGVTILQSFGVPVTDAEASAATTILAFLAGFIAPQA